MPFRPAKKQPQFADLKGILAQSKDTENSLYQTVQEIIERLSQFQELALEDIKAKLGEADAVKKFASRFGSYLTKNDDTSQLPNSVQLLAGLGITLDYSIPNKLIINSTGSSGSNHYDSPLSDGDLTEADLIYASGECIIVQVPVI